MKANGANLCVCVIVTGVLALLDIICVWCSLLSAWTELNVISSNVTPLTAVVVDGFSPLVAIPSIYDIIRRISRTVLMHE